MRGLVIVGTHSGLVFEQLVKLATTNRADRRLVPYRLLRLRFRDFFFGIIGGVVVGGVVGI